MMSSNPSLSLTTDIPEPKSVTYIDHDDPFSLAEDATGAPHIAKLSTHSWVGCGDDIYVLECMAKGFIRIEPTETDGGKILSIISCLVNQTIRHPDKPPKFRATYTPAINRQTARSLGIGPYQRSRVVLVAETLRDAVRGCDKYVIENVVKGPLAMG
jgi:ATP-dependent helicase IRC3